MISNVFKSTFFASNLSIYLSYQFSCLFYAAFNKIDSVLLKTIRHLFEPNLIQFQLSTDAARSMHLILFPVAGLIHYACAAIYVYAVTYLTPSKLRLLVLDWWGVNIGEYSLVSANCYH